MSRDIGQYSNSIKHETEVYNGAYWIPINTLGASRYSNEEMAEISKMSMEEKKNASAICMRLFSFFRYRNFKGKKSLTEAEQILFTATKDYLKGMMNGKTTIPAKAWKTEYAKLTAERKTLNQRYLALKEEVKEAEQIRKSVYSILRQEQREHAQHRTQKWEL